MKFWIKLGIVVSLIVLCMSGALFFYFYKTGSDAIYLQVKNRLEGDALELMQNIDRFFFMRKSDIQMVANLSEFETPGFDPKLILEELTKFRNIYKSYSSISFYDLKGNKLVDTSGLGIGENEGDQIFFKNALKNGLSMAEDVSMSPSLYLPVAYFSALTKDKDGKPVGVVASRVPLYKLGDMGKGIGLDVNSIKKAHFDILDRDGRLLYSSIPGHDFLSKNYIDDDAMQLVGGGTATGFIDLHHGRATGFSPEERHINAFAVEPGYLDFEGNGWMGITYIPEQIVYEPIRKLRSKMLVVFIVGTFCAIVFVFFISRRFTRPIGILSKAAGDIGSGKLDKKIVIKSKDEIGVLAGSFDRMRESILHSRMELQEYNKTLEQAVQKRTAELQNSLSEVEAAKEVTLSILEDTNAAKQALEKAMIELHEKETQLISAGKLAGIGQMAAGVAHEINNPLTAILGYSQLIMADKDIEPQLKEDLMSIERESKRCVTIIENLLNFARPMKPEKKDTNLQSLVESVLKLTEYTLTRDRISVVRNFDRGLPEILVDPNQIQQVLFNIILNAGNAMPHGGTLTICTSYLVKREAQTNKMRDTRYASRSTDGNFVEISVADTGEGISPENIGRIFEPFFTTSYEKGMRGAGLGLSISYSIIKEHGGTIEVESELGKGSVFRVLLPVASC